MPTHHVDKLEPKRFRLADLSLYYRNAREGDVGAISVSLASTGQYRRIVVNAGTHTGRPLEILAGNHTAMAARALDWTHIDGDLIDVDEATARSIVLRDNRLAELASYNEEQLLELLKEERDAGTLEESGFDPDYVDDLQRRLEDQNGADADLAGDLDDAPPVRKETIIAEDELWLLGPHRLVCGDSTKRATYQRLLGDDRVPHMVWTDPPYGVEYEGGTGLTIENDTASGLGPLLRALWPQIIQAVRPGAPIYVAHPSGPLQTEFIDTFREAGLLFRQALVWVKDTFVLGHSDYHQAHEPIIFGDLPYADTHDLIAYGFTKAPKGSGRLGRGGPHWHGDNKQRTVFAVDKPRRSADHPTMKPIELIRPMIRNSCAPGGLVLDPFGGSGSTLIAAHAENRRAALIELSPHYADVIARRWQMATGILPINAATGVAVDFAPTAD